MTQQLGRYEILAEIGRGAMGTVFQARDPRIDRIVAIKTISVPETGAQEMEHYRQRFFREAQAAGRLSAPGIVTIYDVGEDDATKTPFIVMEYVSGHTLDQVVGASAPAKFPREKTLDLLQQLADALDYAHNHGIVHRDIKPSNIIVTDEDRAKIADFGIARLPVGDATIPGQVLGTPAYMSPEQLNGNPVDGRSDLFSLGVIAYWLLTGEKPFSGDTLTSISVQIITRDPAPATSIDASLNPEFDYVLGKALAKDPGQRYQRCRDFSLDLQDANAGRPLRSKIAVTEQTVAIKTTPHGGTAVAARPARAPQTTTTVPASSSKKKIRRPVILYSVLGLVLIAGLALLAFNSKPRIISPPANLQIIGECPFQQAEIAVWVDGELRYRGQVTGTMHKHGKGNRAAYSVEGSIDLTIPLHAGKHKIRVHMTAPGASYDNGGTIEGQFNPNTAKTLRADFSNQGLNLNWEP